MKIFATDHKKKFNSQVHSKLIFPTSIEQADSHLVDEFVVEVWHFQLDQTSGGLLDVSAA